jgi:hypothetical protein
VFRLRRKFQGCNNNESEFAMFGSLFVEQDMEPLNCIIFTCLLHSVSSRSTQSSLEAVYLPRIEIWLPSPGGLKRPERA